MRIWDDTRPPSYLIHESTSDDVFGTDRVESAEAMPKFEADFMISAQRRNLPRDYVDIVIARCRGFRQRV